MLSNHLIYPITCRLVHQLQRRFATNYFNLQSEIYSSSRVTVTQQVQLKNGVISDQGDTLMGEFSLTLWGLTPYPLAVSGDFSLMRIGYGALHPDKPNKAYMPIVMR